MLVSVVIPSYNRFDYLMNAIQSVLTQTYTLYEIIIVNDHSTDQRYYNCTIEKLDSRIKFIHLPKNTKSLFGFVCSNYVRDVGVANSKGKYIAFLDDDDIWFPTKLEKQIDLIKITNTKLCCTDGYYGLGVFDPSKSYKLYNKESNYEGIKSTHESKGSNLLKDGFPDIFNHRFLSYHNCVVTSSVLINKELLVDHSCIQYMMNGMEDYVIWMTATNFSDMCYVKDPCFYYDGEHGDGRNY